MLWSQEAWLRPAGGAGSCPSPTALGARQSIDCPLSFLIFMQGNRVCRLGSTEGGVACPVGGPLLDLSLLEEEHCGSGSPRPSELSCTCPRASFGCAIAAASCLAALPAPGTRAVERGGVQWPSCCSRRAQRAQTCLPTQGLAAQGFPDSGGQACPSPCPPHPPARQKDWCSCRTQGAGDRWALSESRGHTRVTEEEGALLPAPLTPTGQPCSFLKAKPPLPSAAHTLTLPCGCSCPRRPCGGTVRSSSAQPRVQPREGRLEVGAYEDTRHSGRGAQALTLALSWLLRAGPCTGWACREMSSFHPGSEAKGACPTCAGRREDTLATGSSAPPPACPTPGRWANGGRSCFEVAESQGLGPPSSVPGLPGSGDWRWTVASPTSSRPGAPPGGSGGLWTAACSVQQLEGCGQPAGSHPRSQAPRNPGILHPAWNVLPCG